MEIFLPIIIVVAVLILIFIIIHYATRRGSGGSYQRHGHWRPVFTEDRGEQGEKIVAQILARNATNNDKIFNDIILTNPQNGMSSQIDHVFIATRGIFVIETKNYSGKIYGDDIRRQWTQYLNYGETENKFHSPVKQNRTHVYIVSKILQTNIPITSVIVFVQGNIEHINSEFIYTPQTFENLLKNTPEFLSVQEVQSLSQALARALDNTTTHYEHIQNTQNQQTKIANNICPRCNANLILRDGKYGKFYGCSNYPNCKFKKEL